MLYCGAEGTMTPNDRLQRAGAAASPLCTSGLTLDES
jgi:hypothetical protein